MAGRALECGDLLRVFTVSAVLFIAAAGIELLGGGCADSRPHPPGLTLSAPWMSR